MTDICDITDMTPAAVCYVLGKSNSWDLLHVLGRKNQIYTCTKPLTPLQQLLDEGSLRCLHHKK